MKIEAKYLRVGNFVLWDLGHESKVVIIKSISETTCWVTDPSGGECEVDNDQLMPYPLIDSGVEIFGFSDAEYKPGYTGADFKANLIIDFVLTKPGVMGSWQTYYVWEHVKNMYTKVEYVHDLQNIFHAVTHQELTLKPKP